MSEQAETSSDTDVVVIGAGAIGLSCAWRLARRGLRVRILERDRPGAGSSSVAAGMLAPVGEAAWGEERQLALALESHSRWPSFAEELAREGADPGFERIGSLHVALDRDEAAELRRRYELMRECGLDAEWLPPGEARVREPGLAPAVGAAIAAPHEAAVDTLRLLGALRTAAENRGADVRVGADAAEALLEGGRLAGVRDSSGREHRARHTVLATGSWSEAAWLPEAARPPVRPVKGQVLTLGRPGTQPIVRTIVASERVYLVPRADGRLLVGATVEELGFDTAITAGAVHDLLREAYRTLPDVAELELGDLRAGLRPGTPDNAPIVGRGVLPGLILASGHFRNGILLAPATADGVVAIACGEAPPDALAVADPARFAAGGDDRSAGSRPRFTDLEPTEVRR